MAIDAVLKLAASDYRPTIVPRVVYEFWTVATRPIEVNGLGLTPAQAKTELASAQRYFRTLRDDRGIYEIWLDLVLRYEIRGKRTHDARLAAAMIRHRIPLLLTFNTAHFATFAEIQTIDPEQVDQFVLD